MVSQPGTKRRRILGTLESLLRLPADTQPPGSSETNATAHDNAPSPPSEPRPNENKPEIASASTYRSPETTADDATQVERDVISTVSPPIGSLKEVDLDKFTKAVMDSYVAEGSESLNQIVIFADELPSKTMVGRSEGPSPAGENRLPARRPVEFNIDMRPTDDSASGDSDAPRFDGQCKWLWALFDTGAEVSVISEATLHRLAKGYTKVLCLFEEQQRNMNLVGIGKDMRQSVGLVPLLWCLHGFPDVVFTTTFYVVAGSTREDLVIGRDILNAVHAAVAQEKKRRNKGPKALHSLLHQSVRLLRQASRGSLRTRSHL